MLPALQCWGLNGCSRSNKQFRHSFRCILIWRFDYEPIRSHPSETLGSPPILTQPNGYSVLSAERANAINANFIPSKWHLQKPYFTHSNWNGNRQMQMQAVNGFISVWLKKSTAIIVIQWNVMHFNFLSLQWNRIQMNRFRFFDTNCQVTFCYILG